MVFDLCFDLSKCMPINFCVFPNLIITHIDQSSGSSLLWRKGKLRGCWGVTFEVPFPDFHVNGGRRPGFLFYFYIIFLLIKKFLVLVNGT